MQDSTIFNAGLYELFWYFFLYSFMGWCLEVIFCTVTTGKVVNRGFLNGALCPIYGFGAVIIIIALQSVVDNLFLLYAASVVLTSFLECIAGYLLKVCFNTSWWDYSDEPFNFGGYICLKFSLLWGIAGVLLMRVIHPLLVNIIEIIPYHAGSILLVFIYATILYDAGYTIISVTNLNRDLRELKRISESLRKGSDHLAEGLGSKVLNASEKRDAIQRQLMENNKKIRTRLIHAFPNMKHQKYSAQFEKLKESYKSLVKK